MFSIICLVTAKPPGDWWWATQGPNDSKRIKHNVKPHDPLKRLRQMLILEMLLSMHQLCAFPYPIPHTDHTPWLHRGTSLRALELNVLGENQRGLLCFQWPAPQKTIGPLGHDSWWYRHIMIIRGIMTPLMSLINNYHLLLSTWRPPPKLQHPSRGTTRWPLQFDPVTRSWHEIHRVSPEGVFQPTT